MKEESSLNKIIQSIETKIELNSLPEKSNTISVNELIEIIAKRVKSLIENDFEKFLSLMYRLDVSENRLKKIMASNKGETLYTEIAKAIIKREEEKIKSRKMYKP